MILDTGYLIPDARFARLRWSLSFIQYPVSRIPYRVSSIAALNIQLSACAWNCFEAATDER
jgi:hypothetical protein